MPKFGKAPMFKKVKNAAGRPHGKQSKPQARISKLPIPSSGSRFEPLGDDPPNYSDDEARSTSSDSNTDDGPPTDSTDALQMTQPDLAHPAQPTAWGETDDLVASQRDEMSVILSLLQNMRGETPTTAAGPNVEDEVHRLSMDILKECRDTGKAPADWVVKAAMDSGALGRKLKQAGVNVLGTHPEDIDRAEDRDKFSAMLDSIGVDQPKWALLSTLKEALAFSDRVGFPVLVRPSFVLSGAAMAVASNHSELEKYLSTATELAQDKPVVVSKFILNAKEIEFDGVAQNGKILNYAISEHVENAGVHSGDATLLLPAQKLWVETIRRVKRVSSAICKALRISGPFNIQLMAKEQDIKVIECNLRASRTFPFISKTLDSNFITLATRVMLGAKALPFNISLLDIDYVAVKAPMFSFTRLRGADPTLGVEMASTGEVACFGRDAYDAFLQALEATGFKMPDPKNEILISFAVDHMRAEFLPWAREFVRMGYTFVGTPGTADYFRRHDVKTRTLAKPQDLKGGQSNGPGCALDGSPLPNVVEYIKEGKVDLVINIPEGTKKTEEISAGYLIRRSAVDFGVSLITNVKCASLLVESLVRRAARPAGPYIPVCIEEYYGPGKTATA